MNALAAAGWGALAAFPLVIGAWLALRYRPSPRVTGLVLGFGAGALIAPWRTGSCPGSASRARGTSWPSASAP